jgi:hypothetical protein
LFSMKVNDVLVTECTSIAADVLLAKHSLFFTSVVLLFGLTNHHVIQILKLTLHKL